MFKPLDLHAALLGQCITIDSNLAVLLQIKRDLAELQPKLTSATQQQELSAVRQKLEAAIASMIA